jgi:stage II sporulation protein D
MKKIILIILAIIFIPYIIVSLFIRTDDIKFYYKEGMNVRVKREQTNTIEVVPFEDYVVGVLTGEMPVNFELEALKAQAVAARTYVMKKMSDNRNKDYDIVDTVQNQVYISDEELKDKWKDKYQERINKVKRAVLETKGEYLSYNGKVIEAFFFSTSVGKTENSEEVFKESLPYLRSVDSTWDEEVSPVFNDSKEYSLQEFFERLNLKYSDQINVEVLNTTSTGRIKNIKINGKKFTGSEVYKNLNLRSTFFEINQVGSNVIINTKGYGHGVGMSQYGALAMAKKGYKYDEILKYYYQNVQIEKI